MKRYPGYSDEWYPVFGLIDRDTDDSVREEFTIELSDEDYADYERMMAEFDEWQKRLGAAFTAFRKLPRV